MSSSYQQEDEAKGALEQIRLLATDREMQRARAELSSHELGRLLKSARDNKYSEAALGLAFRYFVESLADSTGAPRSIEWANKLIEMYNVLDDWTVLRAYHRYRIESPTTHPCQGPDLGGRKKMPCVSDATMFRAVKVLKARGRLDEVLEAAELEVDTTPAQRAAKARFIVENEAIVLAHMSVTELNDLLRAEKGDSPLDEDFVTIVLKLPPSVATEFEEVTRWCCSPGMTEAGDDPVDYDEASWAQRIERLNAFLTAVQSSHAATKKSNTAKKRKATDA